MINRYKKSYYNMINCGGVWLIFYYKLFIIKYLCRMSVANIVIIYDKYYYIRKSNIIILCCIYNIE